MGVIRDLGLVYTKPCLRVIPPSTKTRRQKAVLFALARSLDRLICCYYVSTTGIHYMIACERGRCTCCPKQSGERMVVRHLLLSIPLRRGFNTHMHAPCRTPQGKIHMFITVRSRTQKDSRACRSVDERGDSPFSKIKESILTLMRINKL